MQRFEYDVYTVTWGSGTSTAGIKSELNRRGAEGWELVGLSRDESPTGKAEDESTMFVLKRAR